MKASVQVVYVWLFTTIVTACFQILDCSPVKLGDSILILDPTLPCPLGGHADSDAGPAVFAIIVLLLYVVPFIFRLFSLCCKSDSWWDSHTNKARWRWAVEDYEIDHDQAWAVRRRLALNWEAVVVLTKLFMVGGSVLMYSNNRAITHFFTMSVVLLLQLLVRPYRDTLSNVCAIAFTVCDIVGIFSATSQIAAVQTAFIVILLLVLLLMLLPLLSSCRARVGDAGRAAAVASSRGLASSSMFAEFTDPWEKVLVAPYLLVATVLSRVAVLLLCIPSRSDSSGSSGGGGTAVTKVSPRIKSWE
jgi:hypothetical protein